MLFIDCRDEYFYLSKKYETVSDVYSSLYRSAANNVYLQKIKNKLHSDRNSDIILRFMFEFFKCLSSLSF